MKVKLLSSLIAVVLLLSTLSVKAQKTVVGVAASSPDHTTLVAAIKAAGLVEALEGKGPFTVFAPTNEAFNKLPEGTVANLLKPENKATLTKILTYHVVPGKLTAKDVIAAIKKGNGKAEVKTLEGEMLQVSLHNGKVMLTDAKGGTSMVTASDLMAGNGVVHVINTVLMPK
ncbi:fasciclin domain-containing protein [Hydrotalea sp.]|uniref:fasciclin domain-containing protein n=1 Tax=Hydrotalea sp. TaxID=2881279 RepID=UPI003D1073C1